MKKTSVIIVNYNAGHLIQACIDSVLNQIEVEKEIIVIDNASTDESLSVLRAYGNKIQLILNKENVGFGRANNKAVEVATGDFLFLLNPDAVFQDKKNLKNMTDYMEMNAEIGLAGTQVMRMNKGGYSAPQYFYPGQRYTSLDFSVLPGKIAWVIGASMMIRREVFKLVNGFDNDFFLYGEEADLCLRIRKAGYVIGYNPVVMVNHVGGGSEQKTLTADLWRKKQKGLHLFICKNYPESEAKKVVLRYSHRAKRKLFYLKINKLLGFFDEKKQARYDRYQVVLKTSEDFLKGNICV